MEQDEIRSKVKDFESSMSYIWKILCTICDQNLLYDV